MLRLAGLLVAMVATVAAAPRAQYKVVAPRAVGATGEIPKTVYLNRCVGGCTIYQDIVDDARTQTSTIPPPGHAPGVLSEFAWTDGEWNAFVACMHEVFSPYAITLTETRPPGGTPYGEHIVAGFAHEIYLTDTDYGGVAPFPQDCTFVDYPISFTFANEYTSSPQFPIDRVHELCWTAAQEIGHTYALDHEYEFLDTTSTCNDPMTYRTDCGGEKFFRKDSALCGEYASRGCWCSAQQTSHKALAAKLGAATPTTGVTLAITGPADGATIADGETVHAMASAQRGVATLQYLLNGHQWQEVVGAPFGPTGQPATDYTFTLPNDVPDGIIDIEVFAHDDLEVTATAKVTVTKGAPCVTADTCAKGQLCDNGRCFWNPPVGEVGDGCSFDEFCVSGRCDTNGGKSFCTEPCNATVTDVCGDKSLECKLVNPNNPTDGYCWPVDGGGCCSAAGGGSPWSAFALAFAAVAWLRRRR